MVFYVIGGQYTNQRWKGWSRNRGWADAYKQVTFPCWL